MMHVELQLRRPSFWFSCLWKDYRQIQPMILAVALSLVAIQLVMLTIALNLNELDAPSRIAGHTGMPTLFWPCAAGDWVQWDAHRARAPVGHLGLVLEPAG
jgi:hypothetical protein